nr:hypothetical protein [Tanacetum cinerariifolium]
LELEIFDDTAEVVVIMFDETERSMVKCSASSILGSEDHVVEEENVDESGSSGTVAATADPMAPVLKSLAASPSVATPSKLGEQKKPRSKPKGGDVGCSSDTRKRKRPKKGTINLKGKAIDDTSNRAISKAERRTTGPGQKQLAKKGQKLAVLASAAYFSHYQSSFTTKPIMGSYCLYEPIHVHHLMLMIGTEVSYYSLGASSYQCSSCNATMWYEERNNKGNRDPNPTFSLCCQQGKVLLPRFNKTPTPLNRLLDYSQPATSSFRN